MSSAEEKASKRWPIHPWTILPKEGEHGEIINFDEWLEDFRLGVQSFSLNAGYKEGYEQAEDDLALTWEDIQLLDHFVLELVREEKEGKDWGDGKEFYTEVLKRFKEAEKNTKTK